MSFMKFRLCNVLVYCTGPAENITVLLILKQFHEVSLFLRLLVEHDERQTDAAAQLLTCATWWLLVRTAATPG